MIDRFREELEKQKQLIQQGNTPVENIQQPVETQQAVVDTTQTQQGEEQPVTTAPTEESKPQKPEDVTDDIAEEIKITQNPQEAFKHYYRKYKELQKQEEQARKQFNDELSSYRKKALFFALLGASPEAITTGYNVLKDSHMQKNFNLYSEKETVKDNLQKALTGIQQQQEAAQKAELEQYLMQQKMQAEKEMLQEKLKAEKEMELLKMKLQENLLRTKNVPKLDTRARARLAALDNAEKVVDKLMELYPKERGTMFARLKDYVTPSEYDKLESMLLDQYLRGMGAQATSVNISTIKKQLPGLLSDPKSAHKYLSRIKENIINTKTILLSSGYGDAGGDNDPYEQAADEFNNANLEDLLGD